MFRVNLAARPNLELTGNWGLLPDPMERSLRQTWWRSQRPDGHFFPSFDDDAYWPTTVPGAWHLLHPELSYYEGHAIYRLNFTYPTAEAIPGCGDRIHLAFEGVADRCRVFLNGHLVAEHDGAYTPFSCDITDRLAGQNRLHVLVDNRRRSDAVPGEIHDWFHQGGIHGPVRLYRLPATHIQDVALKTTLLPGARVRLDLDVRLHSHERETLHSVTARLLASDGVPVPSAVWTLSDTCASSWQCATLELSVASFRLWSPDDPYLYRLVVETADDRWEDDVGLREIRTCGRELLLNGHPLYLRGVCSWIEDPQRGLYSASAATAEKLVNIARDLHANFFRAAHWPQSRDYVRACDRAGILLWMEIPAYWMPNMAEPAPMKHARDCAAEMLCAHRNAPSIILWSVGNECVFHDTGPDTATPRSNLAWFIEGAEYFHEHDSTRLVTYTGGMEGAATPHMEKICPPALVAQLDVIGVNTYAGINDGAPHLKKPGDTVAPTHHELAECIRHAASFGKPVILAENGIDAVRGETGFDFGEDRQDAYYRRTLTQLETLRDEGLLQGVSFFVLTDYRTPIKLGRHQGGRNRKGLLTETLVSKKAFYIVANAFERIASG